MVQTITPAESKPKKQKQHCATEGDYGTEARRG